MRTSSTVAVLAVIVTITLGATGCGSERSRTVEKPAPVDISAAPSAPRWESYRGVYVPYTTAGPGSLTGVAPTGYQHNPQGAVTAAMQGQARLALAPDGDAWANVAALLVAPGRGRDGFAEARMLASEVAEADPAHTAQFAGFRAQGWSPAAVTVWLATRKPDRTLSAQPTQLIWLGGDWKIDLPAPQQPGPDGRVATDPIDLPNLNGYTEFNH